LEAHWHNTLRQFWTMVSASGDSRSGTTRSSLKHEGHQRGTKVGLESSQEHQNDSPDLQERPQDLQGSVRGCTIKVRLFLSPYFASQGVPKQEGRPANSIKFCIKNAASKCKWGLDFMKSVSSSCWADFGTHLAQRGHI